MKDILGYEGIYMADVSGKIFSVKRGIFLRPRIRKNGYAYVNLSHEGKVRDFLVHRLVLSAHIGDIGKKDVNHINGKRSDNRLENLEAVDRRDNILHGLFVLRSGSAKFGHKDVLNVRARVASGESQADVARSYGVHKQTINQIVRGKSYTGSSVANNYPKPQ